MFKIFKSYNFKNNQNYIKSKNFDKYFFRAKIFYYFLQNLLLSAIIFIIILLIFILLFKSNLFTHSGLVYKENQEYFYFNKKFVFLYFFIGIGSIILFFYKNKFFKKISGEDFYKNINNKEKIIFIKNRYFGIGTFIIFVLLSILLLIGNGFLFAINIFLFGFFLLIFHLIFDIYNISKEKTYIEKPIKNYFNIFTSIEKNNIIIRKYEKTQKAFFVKILSIFYLIFLFILIGIFIYGVGGGLFEKNISYYFMSVNLDNFKKINFYRDLKKNEMIKINKLDLSDKNLGDESIDNIFEYLENKQNPELDISGNNYTTFIHGKNKIRTINYGKIENYYKNNNLESLIGKYKKVKKYYNEIIFSNNFDFQNSELNILDFLDKYKIFKKYYKIEKKGINKLAINFVNNINYFSKNNIDIRKRIENGKFFSSADIVNKILEKSKNSFLIFINNKEFFKKGFNIKIKNAFLDNKNLKEKIEFFKKINNKNINLSFFDFDDFCNKNKQKFDCSILKNRFKNIGNENKKEILLNNNYIFSNYNGLNKDYKNIKNQAVLLDIYFKLKNRKTKLEKLNLSNNYINNTFFQNLVLDFKNVKTINLANIESDKPFIINSKKTSIKNFILTNGTKFKIIRENDKENLNILIDDYKTNTKTLSSTYVDIPDIFINLKGDIYSIGILKNILYKYPNAYLGHYKFDNNKVNNFLKNKYYNSFGLNNIFNEVFKIGNIYIFVKNMEYTCRKVSRIQTDFYDFPKGGKVEYLGKGGNFFYSNIKNNKAVGKTVILYDKTFYSNYYENKNSHNYIYKDNGRKFAYRGDGEIIINIGSIENDTKNMGTIFSQGNIKINTKNMGTIFLEGFYKNGILFTSNLPNKSQLIYAEIKNGKAILHTLQERIGYKSYKSIFVEDGNNIKILNYFTTKEELKLKKMGIKFDINTRALIIGKRKIYLNKLNSFGKILVDKNKKYLYFSYGIGKKYYYLKINLKTFKKETFGPYNHIKDSKISDNGNYGIITDNGIFIDGKKIIDGKGKILNGFNFGKGDTFYYTKYEEEKDNNQKLSFFYNYKCEKNN